MVHQESQDPRVDDTNSHPSPAKGIFVHSKYWILIPKQAQRCGGRRKCGGASATRLAAAGTFVMSNGDVYFFSHLGSLEFPSCSWLASSSSFSTCKVMGFEAYNKPQRQGWWCALCPLRLAQRSPRSARLAFLHAFDCTTKGVAVSSFTMHSILTNHCSYIFILYYQVSI